MPAWNFDADSVTVLMDKFETSLQLKSFEREDSVTIANNTTASARILAVGKVGLSTNEGPCSGCLRLSSAKSKSLSRNWNM
jgi:hypothetical protein